MKRPLTLLFVATLASAPLAFTYLDSPPPKWGGGGAGTSSGGDVTFFMTAAGTDDVAGGPATGDGEAAVLASELSEWDAATAGNLDLEYGGSTPAGPDTGDGLNVVGWGSLGEGVGAVTAPMYFGDTLEEADIEMNSDMDWTDGVMLENVILHELGHAVGMDHEDDVPAVMASYVTGTTSLAADDVAGISALYGTGTGSDGVGGGTGGGGGGTGGGTGGGSSGSGSSGSSSSSSSGSSDDSGHSGSKCFVATASWGREAAPVRDLISFRADWLHPAASGRVFDRAYHGFGPHAAAAIASTSRPGGRALLVPFAAAAGGGGLSALVAAVAAIALLIAATRRLR